MNSEPTPYDRELAAAIAARAAAGVTWIDVRTDGEPRIPLGAHHIVDEHSSVTVRATRPAAVGLSPGSGWRWTAYHDGRVVTHPYTLHASAANAMRHAEHFINNYRKDDAAMGPYCAFCGLRCFVHRELPDRSWSGLMATCAVGTKHDRDKLGYDHSTAINPVTVARLLQMLTDLTALEPARARRMLAVLLRGLDATQATAIPADQFPTYVRYLEETTDSDHADAL